MGESEKSVRLPSVYEKSWKAILLHLLIMGALIFGAHRILEPSNLTPSIAAGLVVYLVYSQTVRRLAGRNMFRGHKLLTKEAYAEAIEAYQRAYQFFSRHSWLDKYRALVLLNSSAYSYREIALCNVAFAHGQMGDGKKAIEIYRRTLAEFPECPLAKTSLQLAEAVSKDATESAG